jgi:hypothetical protein
MRILKKYEKILNSQWFTNFDDITNNMFSKTNIMVYNKKCLQVDIRIRN